MGVHPPQNGTGYDPFASETGATGSRGLPPTSISAPRAPEVVPAGHVQRDGHRGVEGAPRDEAGAVGARNDTEADGQGVVLALLLVPNEGSFVGLPVFRSPAKSD